MLESLSMGLAKLAPQTTPGGDNCLRPALLLQHFACRLAGGGCLWKPSEGAAFPMSQLSFLCEITYPSIGSGI